MSTAKRMRLSVSELQAGDVLTDNVVVTHVIHRGADLPPSKVAVGLHNRATGQRYTRTFRRGWETNVTRELDIEDLAL